MSVAALPRSAPLRVLVVDDNPFILRFLREIFDRHGCVTVTAGSAKRALRLLGAVPYDAVFSDIRMRDISGLDLLRSVRNRQPGTPVVLITGHASVETAVEALRQGALDYLTKPFDMEAIEQVLARILEERERRQVAPGGEGLDRGDVLGLMQIADATLASTEAPPVLNLILECCLKVVGADGAAICLEEGEGRAPLAVYRGDPSLIERLQDWEGAEGPGRDASAAAEWCGLSLPIEGRSGRFGEFRVARWGARGALLAAEQELAGAFAKHAALVVENLSLHASLQANILNTIRSFVYALEAKDSYTRGHSTRVALYAAEVAGSLGVPSDVATVTRYAALLHDLGKLVIYESILQKPSRLARDEYSIMMQHPLIGEGILSRLGFLQQEAEAVRHHHERYDGKGFPDRLAGEAISLPARIVTAADAFDAMTSDRPYRAAMPLETALREMRKGAGSQFDPRVAEALVGLPLPRLVEISQIDPDAVDFLQ